MRSFIKHFTPVLLMAALSAPVLTGCAVHARVYDSYDQQYRAWPAEQSYYIQWENDTHRHHEKFNRRSADEQNDYWKWRHSHDNDHDHDHDH